jgi:hypothetical protein
MRSHCVTQCFPCCVSLPCVRLRLNVRPALCTTIIMYHWWLVGNWEECARCRFGAITLSSEEHREGNSFKAFSIDMLCIVITATLQVSFPSYVFLFAGHYGREKEARTLFSTAKKVSGRIRAMSQWNMLSARLQTTDHDMIPSGRVGVWRGSGDCWTAFGRSRLFYYYTDLKHNPFWVACSEQACCANSSRMNSSNHHLPWNLAHAHLLHS